MSEFVLGVSLAYFLATLWYYLIDRKNKNKIVIIPSEFLYVLVTFAGVGWFYFNVWPEVKLVPHFYVSTEKIMLTLSGVLGLTMIWLHALTKYWEDRSNIKTWPKWAKLIVHHLHIRISHKLLYFSLALALCAFSFLEIKQLMVVADPPSLKNVFLSSLLFTWAFYKTIVHGNTWRLELLVLPFFSYLIARTAIAGQVEMNQAPIALFSFSVLLLTPIAIIYEKVIVTKFRKSSVRKRIRLSV